MIIEGFYNVKPAIKVIKFERGKILFYLADGRIIISPISAFPSIKQLNPNQRKKYQILGDEGFTFDDCNEVFAIEQVLGNYQNYRHN